MASEQSYLGDGVYVRLVSGMLEVTGNAYERPNTVFLELAQYEALRRFAIGVGFEMSAATDRAAQTR